MRTMLLLLVIAHMALAQAIPPQSIEQMPYRSPLETWRLPTRDDPCYNVKAERALAKAKAKGLTWMWRVYVRGIFIGYDNRGSGYWTISPGCDQHRREVIGRAIATQ